MMCKHYRKSTFAKVHDPATEPFSLFQNFQLGIASTGDKCHFAISWARSYQCVCKSLSEYFKRFMSYAHFSLNVWGQNIHKLTREKKLLKLSQGEYRTHSESQPSASLSVDFLRDVQCEILPTLAGWLFARHFGHRPQSLNL